MRIEVFELLNLRTRWEEIVHEYKLDKSRREGIVENLEWFIDNGAKSNRFRPHFDEAIEIAKTIVENANEKTDIPGLFGEEVEAL